MVIGEEIMSITNPILRSTGFGAVIVASALFAAGPALAGHGGGGGGGHGGRAAIPPAI